MLSVTMIMIVGEIVGFCDWMARERLVRERCEIYHGDERNVIFFMVERKISLPELRAAQRMKKLCLYTNY